MNTLHLVPVHGVDGPPVDHDAPFRCQIRVDDTQASNEVDHVNNIEFLRWIDRASELHCDAAGWPRQRMLDAGMMWFVARHEIDYRAEVSIGDDLLLSTWVEDVRRVKSWRSTAIHCRAEDTWECACRARTLWVLVDLATRRPRPVPADMATAFAPLAAPRLGGGP